MKDRGLNQIMRTVKGSIKVEDYLKDTTLPYKVLEIGCGLGNVLADLRKILPNAELWGVNKQYHQGQIESDGINYVYGDAGLHLPFEDNTFDFIFSFNTLQFIEDKLGMITEAYRVMKRGAACIIHYTLNCENRAYEYSVPILTITDGRDLLAFPKYLEANPLPGIYVNNINDNYILLEIRKENDLLSFPIDEEYYTEDLTDLYPDHKNYVCTTYKLCKGMDLIPKSPRALVIAISPHGYGHLTRGEMLSQYFTDNGINVTYLSNKILKPSNFDTILIPDSIFDGNPLERKGTILDIIKKVGMRSYDMVIIDHYPFGKLALGDGFLNLKKIMHKNTKFISVYRDIISVEDIVRVPQGCDILNENFDMLAIFSDDKFIKLPESVTNNLSIPVKYFGYIDWCYNPQITIFGGGGKYNMKFYTETLETLERINYPHPYKIKLFTGDKLPKDQVSELTKHFPNIDIQTHTDELYKEIEKSEITISTFGYNTFSQLMHFNNYNIIVPLPKNHNEQYTRALKFKNVKNNVSILLLDSNFKHNLTLQIDNIFNKRINRNGLAYFTDEIKTKIWRR